MHAVQQSSAGPGRKKKTDGLPGLLPAMAAMGLDDESLGEKIGRSGRSVQNWRIGAKPLNTYFLRKIAAILGVSSTYLLDGPSENK